MADNTETQSSRREFMKKSTLAGIGAAG
ncbi:MAG: twin-arginine translocation signal domain-containing protein, partial [Planctomycetes bacterium]|nr:twin-arginine translocation signal domain-containing protein [Planctomycetota bacterium]